MASLSQMLRRVLPPVPTGASEGGEVLASRIRVLVVAVLVSFPLSRLVDTPYDRRVWWGLGAALLALLYSAAIAAACHRDRCPRRIGYLTSVIDVTFVSAVLVGFTFSERPEAAAHSAVVFALYMLAILATSLRYNVRICLTAGALAVVQYGLLLAIAERRWTPAAGWHPPLAAGASDWKSNLARLVLLGIATLLAATSVRRARELRQQAIHDRLTGLHNRGFFDERLAEETARARRSGAPLTVALLDIDRFKQFNDTFGHRAGDEALRALGSLLASSFRGGDEVARYGGEEFAVLLPETAPTEGVDRIEEVRAAVGRTRISGRAASWEITLSAGVATLPDDGTAVDQVLAAADRRLYRAKALGRNLTVGPSTAPLDRIVQRLRAP